MSRYEFRLPDIGEGTAEAECVAWHVSVGDRVEEDQPLVDMMTDKATVEVTSPVEGIVVERRGAPGEMMQVGGVVLVIQTDSVAVEEAPFPAVPEDLAQPTVGILPITTRPIVGAPLSAARVLATPAVRQRARDAGVELARVMGSGPHGRVRQLDLEAFLRALRPAAVEIPGTPPATQSDNEFDAVPVIGLRRRIAERMQDTNRRIPHFSYIEEVDASALERVRVALNRKHEGKRAKLTLLPFLIRAIAKTLPDFPHLNALFDDGAGVVRQYRAFHVGLATQTPKGLVVTVLRDADKKDLWALAAEIARLSDLARTGRAAPADLTGSTFTITSLGLKGGLATTPVINSPEVAIVGVNKMMERPIVANGAIVIARMMNLSSSFDHRVVDGWDAASFIQQVKTLLEEPALLLVD